MQLASFSRRKGFLVLTAVLLLALGLTRSVKPLGGAPVTAHACPPGYVSGTQLATEQTRERRAEVNGLRARSGVESDALTGGCRARGGPERSSELMATQQESS